MDLSRFARAFRLYERVFPPQGGEPYLLPSRVSDHIQLTFDPFERIFLHNAAFGQIRIDNALTVAGTNIYDFNSPAPGYVRFPTSLAGGNPDAAARIFRLFVQPETVPVTDPWGSYQAQNVIDEQNIPTGEWRVFRPVAYPSGNKLEMIIFGMTGGNSISIHMNFFDVPGELVESEHLILPLR